MGRVVIVPRHGARAAVSAGLPTRLYEASPARGFSSVFRLVLLAFTVHNGNYLTHYQGLVYIVRRSRRRLSLNDVTAKLCDNLPVQRRSRRSENRVESGLFRQGTEIGALPYRLAASCRLIPDGRRGGRGYVPLRQPRNRATPVRAVRALAISPGPRAMGLRALSGADARASLRGS